VTLLLVLESVELAASVDDLEVPLRSIAPVVEILPLRLFDPVPKRVRLPKLDAEAKVVVSYWVTLELVLMSF
jgi:hypothetical protein